METLLVFIIFFIGLVAIIKGGDMFVDAAIWCAEKFGVSPMIIGATIVSFATTLPELLVSSVASDKGHSDIAIGNAIGSTICNIAFIIGLCAFIKPIKIVKNTSFLVKGLIMLSCLLLFYIFALDGVVSFKEGLFLILLFILFIIINVLEHLKNNNVIKKRKEFKSISNKEAVVNVIKFILGTFLIVVGAHILVNNGIKISTLLGIPKQIVSLTLIAVGTSLPELVTAIVALIKGESNISVGNIIGANILNMTIVLGISTLVSEHGLLVNYPTIYLHIPFSFLVMVIFVSIGFIKKEITRKSGLLLLGLYVLYMCILF